MKNIIAIVGAVAMGGIGFAIGYRVGLKKADAVVTEEVNKFVAESKKNDAPKEKTAKERTEETRHMTEEEMHEYLMREFGPINDEPYEEIEGEDEYPELDDNGLEVIPYYEAIEKYGIDKNLKYTGVAIHMTAEERAASEPEIIYANEAGEENETGETYEILEMEWHTDGILTEDPYQMVEWDPIETIGNEACDILETSPGATIYVRNHRLRKDIMVEQTGETYEEMFAARPWLHKKED